MQMASLYTNFTYSVTARQHQLGCASAVPLRNRCSGSVAAGVVASTRRYITQRRLSTTEAAESAGVSVEHEEQLPAVTTTASEEVPARSAKARNDAAGRGAAVRSRVRRRATSWADESKPNTGIVGVSPGSRSAGAAARVASELSDAGRLVRVVAREPRDIPQAMNVLAIASRFTNADARGEGIGSSEQRRRASDAASPTRTGEDEEAARVPSAPPAGLSADVTHKVLLFQPSLVAGVLIAPPELPAGGYILFTRALAAGDARLAAALKQRADLLAAEAAGEPEQQRTVARGHWHVGVSSASDPKGAAHALSESLVQRGWAELTAYGGPKTTQLAVEVLTRARKEMHRRGKGDATAVLLGFWKKPTSQPTQVQQQQEPAAGSEPDVEVGGAAQLPYRCCTLLVLGCGKNQPLQLSGMLNATTSS